MQAKEICKRFRLGLVLECTVLARAQPAEKHAGD